MKKLLIPVILCILSVSAQAADLGYLVDVRNAIMDGLGISTPTNFFTTEKLNRIANRAIKFVEDATQSSEETIGFATVDGVFRYPITDSTIAQNGIKFMYRLPASEELEPQGLVYKPINEFTLGGKTDGTVIYSLWQNTIYVSRVPVSDGDSLYALAYKVSYDLDSDSSIVPLPRGWKRELAVLYALKLCAEAQQNEAKTVRLWNEWKEAWQIATGIPFKQAESLNPTNP